MTARVLIGANAMAFAAALASANSGSGILDQFLRAALIVEPVLILCLVTLAAAAPWLTRLAFVTGTLTVLAIALCATTLVTLLTGALVGAEVAPNLWRALALAALATLVLLWYLNLMARAYSPALAEARLQALQARIRPHFLFNSLNAVLSLIRRDPRRAEHALEDLADLFRTLMTDAREFAHLADEIALLERYARLEQLRLGDRLRIVWELDAAPADAILPPLVLQPLLENAIYHGVEPLPGPSQVSVRIGQRGRRLAIEIENPYTESHQHRAGNRMALANIRERLALFFDAEARLETRIEDTRYICDLEIPYRVAPRRGEAKGPAGRETSP